MKFRCERDTLVEALGTASRAVSGRGGMLAVLSGLRADLLGDTLTLTGSDLDLTITVGAQVAGQADGVVVFPRAKLLSDVVRALPPGALTVEVGGAGAGIGDEGTGQALITSGRSEFSLRVLPADEYPKLPVTDADPVQLEAKELALALHQVTPAASTDDNRPIITGVLLAAEEGGLRLVATDSYRLAVRDLAGQSGTLGGRSSVLVPSRALREVERLLAASDTVTLRLGDRDAAFEVGTTRITTRLIEGEFPNYRGLIPSSYPNRLVVGREPLLDAVRRVRLLAQDNTPIRLVLSADGLELLAVTQDVGQAHENLDAKYEGADLTVAFNPEYLTQGVDVTPGDEVVLETIDALKPAVIRSTETQDFLYLLMPVRVS